MTHLNHAHSAALLAHFTAGRLRYATKQRVWRDGRYVEDVGGVAAVAAAGPVAQHYAEQAAAADRAKVIDAFIRAERRACSRHGIESMLAAARRLPSIAIDIETGGFA
jgi:hypothetical protein